MSLRFVQFIGLPEHIAPGGFDHAAVHQAGNRLYVAHTVNNALDVIDCTADRFLHSIDGLTGVAGALVSEERVMVFISNRGENTVGIFAPRNERGLVKVPVGIRPNGLAFDPLRGLLLAANVGDPNTAGSFTLSVVDIERRAMVHSIPVPGRTRWTVFDPGADVFYVNIADPARIVVVEAEHPARVARELTVPAAGPHGLDLDGERQVLYCACDSGKVFAISPSSGEILYAADLSGTPDVIFINKALKHLYVAVGDPGVIDVFRADNLTLLETVSTEKGAHTIAFDASYNKVYAFLPQTHRAQVFADS
jgi:DNA-binding beta-propeller fold protein YncE